MVMQSGLCMTFRERLSFYLVLVYIFYLQCLNDRDSHAHSVTSRIVRKGS